MIQMHIRLFNLYTIDVLLIMHIVHGNWKILLFFYEDTHVKHQIKTKELVFMNL